MANLTTHYMGLELKNPIVPSASPLSRNLDDIKRLEDAGAAAVVLYSLFEEQIDQEASLLDDVIEDSKYRYAESIDFLPALEQFRRDEHSYLDLIQQAKAAVDIPIIASLNGYSEGGWTRYARLCEEAGADALELNVYYLPTSHKLTGSQVEAMYFSILREVKQQASIPVAVKMSPFFSAIPHLATVLERSGANGLVLFNRFYQPDLDIEALEARRSLNLSTSEEMRLPLRWIAILYGQLNISLALTTGVHSATDVIKALMAGADVAQVCSVLLQQGIPFLRELVTGTAAWLESHGYTSVEEVKGVLSHTHTPNAAAFERANYVKLVGQD